MANEIFERVVATGNPLALARNPARNLEIF